MSWVQDTATDFTDLLVRLNDFLTGHGHSLPPIYTGTGTGTVSQVLGTATTVQETISVAFTSTTDFTVTGSVTGSMGTGTVDSAFTHAKVSFLVNAGGTTWASGDTISWVMTPPWACCRLFGGARHLASANFNISIVVDKSTITGANPLATDLPQWGGLQLLQAIEVRSIRLVIYNNPGCGPRDYAVQYSDSGSDGSWVTASSWTAQTWTQAQEQRVHDVAAAGAHLYWRLLVTAANGTNVDITELTFYVGQGGQTLDAIPWFGDAIWRAPGNAGTDQIYVGAKLKWDPTGAYWCWKLSGSVGFAPGTSFENQPGNYQHAYLSLWNSSIPYWFMADGKCCKMVAKITSRYDQGYLGFLDSYMSPGNYPYPLFVGGSMGFSACNDPEATSSAYRYAVDDDTHKAFWAPQSGGTLYGIAALRGVDGVWDNVANGQVASVMSIWPYCDLKGNPLRAQDLRLNLDGSVMTLPCILSDAAPNVYGELSGLAYICGNNQSVENIITINRVDYLVVQNIARVGVGDYVAYRLS